MGSKSAGGGIIALGIVLIVIGIILYLYSNSYTFLGVTVYKEYPYQSIGTILLVLGIVIAVVGGIVSAIPGESSSQTPQQINQYYQQPIPPPYYQAPQIYSPSPNAPIAPGAPKYCANCGAPRGEGSFCGHCGAKFS